MIEPRERFRHVLIRVQWLIDEIVAIRKTLGCAVLHDKALSELHEIKNLLLLAGIDISQQIEEELHD